MDSLITAAARALAAGDVLAALNRVALRDDAPALALRGIAMARLGDLTRATELLRAAARAFGPREPVARARCVVAEAEIALVSRDLGRIKDTLGAARVVLERFGDRTNAAHTGYLEARRLLLVGRLDQAEAVLRGIDAGALPLASRVGLGLVAAGIAMRRIRAAPALAAVEAAERAARETGIPALLAEVERARRALEEPAARLVARVGSRPLRLAEVERLLDTGTLVIDACRNQVRARETVLDLSRRPVLFALARALGEASPRDVSREALLARAFGARHADSSHRARLRVEIGRLRETLRPFAALQATKAGFVLVPGDDASVAVLAPPVEDDHAEVLALLADGEAWSSSALALALGVSSRTVLRALERLAEADKVESFGRGRACRWIARSLPGFPTSLLLPAAPPGL
ncbi:MAG: helix-turn-helix domain-containing protein [Azospirillaceae bacterium]